MKKPSRAQRYSIPSDFSSTAKMSYYKTLGITHIEYKGEIKIVLGRIKPTVYNAWNYWKYRGLE